MTPLGTLLIVFAALSIVSILAILMLILTKDEKKKKYIVYFLGILGMVIAWMNVASLPETFVGEIIRGVVLGAMGAIALLLQLCSRKKGMVIAARVLAVVSVLGGIVVTFLL